MVCVVFLGWLSLICYQSVSSSEKHKNTLLLCNNKKKKTCFKSVWSCAIFCRNNSMFKSSKQSGLHADWMLNTWIPHVALGELLLSLKNEVAGMGETLCWAAFYFCLLVGASHSLVMIKICIHYPHPSNNFRNMTILIKNNIKRFFLQTF